MSIHANLPPGVSLDDIDSLVRSKEEYVDDSERIYFDIPAAVCVPTPQNLAWRQRLAAMEAK